MTELISRRAALKNLALGASALVIARTASAELPHVTAADPVAIALSYNENAKTVEASKFPTFKPEQNCSNCLQFMGKAGDAFGPCNLFPGKQVHAAGWCKVYVKKP